jgi:hypothetical protein
MADNVARLERDIARVGERTRDDGDRLRHALRELRYAVADIARSRMLVGAGFAVAMTLGALAGWRRREAQPPQRRR